MFLHIISRAVAKDRGFVRYFTGELCSKKLHIRERNTKSTTCLECDRLKKIEYRKNHPEKAKESLRKSRIKHIDRRRAENKEWRERNSDYVRESKKRYVQENREKVSASRRRYYLENKERLLQQSKDHRERNKEKYFEMNKRWRENNRDRVRLLNRNRKRKIRKAEGSHSICDIRRLKKLQRMTCAACYVKFKGDEYHVDHIYPLSRGGTNCKKNLQLLCPSCNMSKGAKMPEDFYQERGFLL